MLWSLPVTCDDSNLGSNRIIAYAELDGSGSEYSVISDVHADDCHDDADRSLDRVEVKG